GIGPNRDQGAPAGRCFFVSDPLAVFQREPVHLAGVTDMKAHLGAWRGSDQFGSSIAANDHGLACETDMEKLLGPQGLDHFELGGDIATRSQVLGTYANDGALAAQAGWDTVLRKADGNAVGPGHALGIDLHFK